MCSGDFCPCRWDGVCKNDGEIHIWEKNMILRFNEDGEIIQTDSGISEESTEGGDSETGLSENEESEVQISEGETVQTSSSEQETSESMSDYSDRLDQIITYEHSILILLVLILVYKIFHDLFSGILQ